MAFESNGNNAIPNEKSIRERKEAKNKADEEFVDPDEELKLGVIETLIHNTTNNILIWQFDPGDDVVFRTEFDSETPFRPTFVSIQNNAIFDENYLTLVISNEIYCKSISHSNIIDESTSCFSQYPTSLKVKEAMRRLWDELVSKIDERKAYQRKIILGKVIRDLELLTNPVTMIN